MMQKILLWCWLLGCCMPLFSQTSDLWTTIDSPITLKGEENIKPEKYETFLLNFDLLKEKLADVSINNKIMLVLPFEEEKRMKFEVVEAPMMETALAEKFPEIRTYIGTIPNNPLITARLDVTMHGFHAMIFLPDGQTWFMDPYSMGDFDHYKGYYKKDLRRRPDESGYHCLTKSKGSVESQDSNSASMKVNGDCRLRTFRLAVATTGEYTDYHGGTVNGALSAITTTLNRVNGIYERDLGIHFDLIANNDDIIYLDGATDPFTAGDVFDLTDECNEVLFDVIGGNNFDVGHVFSQGGGGGLAQIGATCTSLKGVGASELFVPAGDLFNVAFVCHELGHQLGAEHTFANVCNGNINQATAVEPGSGSTIMAYAGSCEPLVQFNTEEYFHGINVAEVAAFINFGQGGACGSISSSINNNAPIASAGIDYTIPKSTPFVLTAAGFDADGDVLSYCWEQIDNEFQPQMPPESDNSTGPMFRSIYPTLSPQRIFPNLNAIISNNNPTWEVLPSASRQMDFAVTVRDNNTTLGCTSQDGMRVNVASSGPFLVTSPSNFLSWTAGTVQNVSWLVAGTNLAPVSTTEVDIFLSTDGGYTYPYTLANDVPNDGSQSVFVPNLPGVLNRIMIKGSDNIFFDISNANFAITACANCDDGIQVSPTVLLQGAMLNNGGGSLMRDDLRDLDYIPLREPYGLMSEFGHLGNGGGEEVSNSLLNKTGSDAIVDWVYVDIRLASNDEMVIASRAAVLRRDGRVRDLNGVSAISFPTVPSGNYYVAIRHRNHLGIMTANPIALSDNGTTIDFTNNMATYGQDAQVALADGRRAMWAGNANTVNNLIFQGANNDPNAVFFEVLTAPTNSGQINYIYDGYREEDLDLDGQTIYQGASNESNTIFFNVISHPDNGSFITNFIITEQLP